jgi:hypothetical protein
VVERAVDKAAEASKKAERAMKESRVAMDKLRILENEHDVVAKGHLPELEKEKARLEKRSAKFEEMARIFNQRYQEEKSLTSNLMEKVKFLEETQLRELNETIRHLQEENATKELLMEGLREEHRDAMMQISAQKKLQEMVVNGELEQEDLDGAIIEAGPAKKTPLRRGRNVANGPSRNGAVPIPTQARHSPSGSASNAAETSILYKNIFGESSRSEDWDEEKAKKILDECRSRLFGEGLLNPSPSADSEGSDVDIAGDHDVDGDGRGTGTTAVKKRKGKKKAKK